VFGPVASAVAALAAGFVVGVGGDEVVEGVLADLFAFTFTVVLAAPPHPNETIAKQSAATIAIELLKFIPFCPLKVEFSRCH